MARNILNKTPAPAHLLVTRDSLNFDNHKIKLSSEFFNDLEITNETKFRQVINQFLDKNTSDNHRLIISPSSDIYYEKTFISSLGNEIEVDSFIKMIPFNSKAYREYPEGDGSTLIVTNKQILTVLVDICESRKINVVSLLPQFIEKKLGNDLTLLKKNSLLPIANVHRFQPQIKLNFRINRTILLVSIFCLLLVIMIAMLLFQNHQNPQSTTSQPTSTPTQAVASPTLAVISASTTNVRIILNNLNLEKSANQLRDDLNLAGFGNITSFQSPTNTSSNLVIVTFSVRYPQTLKDKLLPEVKKLSRNLIIKDSNDLLVDVEIIIGQ